ncbi:ML domain-containing protein [Mycena kentingensis (nom. inval.)]|nr:ML domain-containing protein [Mycena kentingensis (nom. inval.)]
MYFLHLILLSFTAVAAATEASWSYTDCGNSIISVESLELSPAIPVPGEQLEVRVTGRARERIEEGATADVSVKLGFIKLLEKSFDVCAVARTAELGVACPTEPGLSQTLVQTVTLPKEIPKAKLNIQVRGSANEASLICLDLKLDFTGGSGNIFRSPF